MNDLTTLLPSVQLPDNDPRRLAALEKFQQTGFPDINMEEWRFTNLRPFLSGFDQIRLIQSDKSQLQSSELSKVLIPGMDCYVLITVNGKLNQALSLLPADIHVNEPSWENEAKDELPEEIATRPLNQLNVAMHTGGLAITIPKNVVIEKPLHLINVIDHAQPGFVFPRHYIYCEANSSFRLVESSYVRNTNTPVFKISHTSIHLSENAQMRHMYLQHAEADIRSCRQTYVSQAAASNYSNWTISLQGPALLRNNLDIYSKGRLSHSDLYGLCFINGDQLVDNHTAMHHMVADCTSNEFYKSVLHGNSKAVFNGKVFVHEDAQKTNAFQRNNNMLLSDKALVHTKPQLEIFADDVRCSHGCTVGRFEESALFYLRSRGIGEELARNLLVEAFAFDVTSTIEIEELRQYLNQLIHAKMEGANVLYN